MTRLEDLNTWVSLRETLRNCLSLNELLWNYTLRQNPTGAKKDDTGKHWRKICEGDIKSQLDASAQELWGECRDRLRTAKLLRTSGDDLYVDFRVFQPIRFANQLFGRFTARHNVRYLTMDAIRHRYPRLSWKVADSFYKLSIRLNSLLEEKQKGRSVTSRPAPISYYPSLVPELQKVLGEGDCGVLDVFLNALRAVDYLWVGFSRAEVELKTHFVDAEFLLSNLYGIPTGIRGFDQLFGGGGPLLAHAKAGGQRGVIPGRKILITGPFGTGKSTLCLHMASEVAKKGGLAVVMPLEQTADECLYSLTAMRMLEGTLPVEIATHTPATARVIANANPECGAIAITRVEKRGDEAFLHSLKQLVADLRGTAYPLLLLCVDPINAIANSPGAVRDFDPRIKYLSALNEACASGINVLITAEGNSLENADTQATQRSFEHNIADTVIQFSRKSNHGYQSRYISILKSRLQREQRGEHPISIMPGEGIVVSPTPAAVNARILPRRPKVRRAMVPFGLPSLDRVVGGQLIGGCDSIVVSGPLESAVNSLAYAFALSGDQKKVKKTLLISTCDDTATCQLGIEQFLASKFLKNTKKGIRDIEFEAIQQGHIQPGTVLRIIEERLAVARQLGEEIDRVVVLNASHWDATCPYIASDVTFGDTLVNLLRREGVTSLVTFCGESRLHQRNLLNAMSERADCVLNLQNYEFRGTQRIRLRVHGSRYAPLESDDFDLLFSKGTLEAVRRSPLLRVGDDGKTTGVKVRVFLHSESELQDRYNREFVRSISPLLPLGVELDNPDAINRSASHLLRSLAVNDECQILQLDEYQLDAENGDILSKLPRNLTSAPDAIGLFHGGACRSFGIPYINNLSLLTYDESAVKAKSLQSWESIARLTQSFDEKHSSSASDVFFSYPKGTHENYNCLFFEILMSLCHPPEVNEGCSLISWIAQPLAKKAAKLFYAVGRKSHRIAKDTGGSATESQAIHVDHGAKVWRHWYTTLNQMLAEFSANSSEGRSTRVRTLPGGISTAGEWYLGIPSSAASNDAAVEVIQMLCRPEAELERVRRGVGMPVRKSFYDELLDSKSAELFISPYFSVDAATLSTMIGSPFRRSRFSCYPLVSGTLSYHLQRILEIPAGKPQAFNSKVDRILNACRIRMTELHSVPSCGCPA